MACYRGFFIYITNKKAKKLDSPFKVKSKGKYIYIFI
jgi:hypothetical protein